MHDSLVIARIFAPKLNYSNHHPDPVVAFTVEFPPDYHMSPFAKPRISLPRPYQQYQPSHILRILARSVLHLHTAYL